MALAQFECEVAALDIVFLAMDARIGLAAGLVHPHFNLVAKLHALVMADAGGHAVFEGFGDAQRRLFGRGRACGQAQGQQ